MAWERTCCAGWASFRLQFSQWDRRDTPQLKTEQEHQTRSQPV